MFKIIYILILLSSLLLNAQNLVFHRYSDENGLASNLTKALIQDKQGFIWVATDAGLSRFDGRRFINITNNFPSLYVKEVIQTGEGKILVSTDFGIGTIEQNDNGYYFNTLVAANNNDKNDVNFPKGILETPDKNIWVGDNTGIIKIFKGGHKKYNFNSKYATDDYINSFLFCYNSKGTLFASSWQGYLFRYDKSNDKFVEINLNFNGGHFFIQGLTMPYDTVIFAATSLGLMKIEIDENFIATSTLVVQLPNTITVYKDKTNKFYLGTAEGGMYTWEYGKKEITNLGDFGKKSIINRITEDKEGNIWTCTDEGIILVQKTFFAEYPLNMLNSMGSKYIRVIRADNDGSIYFTDQEEIYKITEVNNIKKSTSVYKSQGRRVYNFVISNGKIWISERTGDLTYIDGKIQKKFLAKDTKFRITSMDLSSDGTLWGYSADAKEIIKIDKNYKISAYAVTTFAGSEPLLKIIDGEVWFLSNNNKLSFLIYNKSTDKFENKKLKIDFETNTNLVLNDLKQISKSKYIIATNIGVLSLENGVIELCNEINSVGQIYAKSILIDRKNKIWIGTENGLIQYYKNDFTSYTVKDGLPNTVIIPGGLVEDKNGKVWVATGSGLAFWQHQRTESEKTPKPLIYEINIDNKKIIGNTNYFEITGKSMLTFEYSALVYPGNKKYQYRILGVNDTWSDFTQSESQTIINLSEGEYVFQIKAKQTGYLWSDISESKFVVHPTWYASKTFIFILIVIGFVIIVLGTMFLQRKRFRRLERQKIELKNIIEEKIKDLKKEKTTTEMLLHKTEAANIELGRVNKELSKANEFKSDILGIAAHDLKNPIATIISMTQLIKSGDVEKEYVEEMIDLIHTSSLRMLSLITELLENIMVENAKFKMKIRLFSITNLVETVVYENQMRATKKKQVINFNMDEDLEIEGDEKWIHEILDNIINNAVKYSPLGKNIYVSIEDKDEKVQIKVKDEGPGFTDSDKEKLFNKFQKLSARPTGDETSTGLGLAIVKELLNMHKGNIWVEGKEGEGACFVIELNKKLKVD